MNSENVKGFRDIEDSSKKIKIRKIFEDTFSLYGFIPVETPIIEYEEFVKGNNPNDEAVSSIFKLKDRGDRNLALRYELTFQLKRLSQNKKLPYKRFEIGPVFRDEPVGQNRWRQFSQCDADIIGSTVKDEAEILKMAIDRENKTITLTPENEVSVYIKIFYKNEELLVTKAILTLDMENHPKVYVPPFDIKAAANSPGSKGTSLVRHRGRWCEPV